jgi:hypothetical protein
MRWRSAHSNQLRLGGAGVEVRDEKLVVGATRRSLIFPGMSKCKVPMDSQLKIMILGTHVGHLRLRTAS